MYLLDTDTCIFAIRERPPAVLRRLRKHMERGLSVSAITVAELDYGAARSREPERNRLALLGFLSALDPVPFDVRDAQAFGAIKAALAATGQPIGAYDLLIAAQAKARGLVLVTNNTREFTRIPGLRIENWLA